MREKFFGEGIIEGEGEEGAREEVREIMKKKIKREEEKDTDMKIERDRERVLRRANMGGRELDSGRGRGQERSKER